MAERDRQDDAQERGRFDAPRRAAFLALTLEAAWPLVLPLACLASLFLVLSWFGLFAALPPLARLVVVGLLGLAALVAIVRNRHIRLPSAEAVDRRIEARSRLDHQPLRAQSDRQSGEDPFAAALWREHQRRMADRLSDLRGGAPDTRSERLDPLALRAVVALLLVTAFAFSYGPGGGRVSDAFAVPPGLEIARARVDAWVTPPGYTGRPPIFLTDATGPASGPIAVPEGSVLSVRLSDRSGAELAFTPEGAAKGEAVAPVAKDEAPAATPDGAAAVPVSAPATGPVEYEYRVMVSGTARLASGFSALGDWTFAVTPDEDPAIGFKDEPSTARNGALQLTYRVTDDYGVRQAKGEIAVSGADRPAPGARPLFAAPDLKLSLPRRTKGTAEGRTSADLTESPYAGATVDLTLVATDDAGQTGRSATKTMVLPERRFTNPLARAVIEQRRILALDANTVPRVVSMLDAVTLRGEEFIETPSDYLALRAARTRIATAANDDALRSSVDFLWEIALGIEDGNLSLAEKRLRDARENLSEALENGASSEEIDKLMAELREAMQDYMQAMAEAMRNQPPGQQPPQNAQEIRPQDLDKMLDRIEDLAKSGSKDAAQQLLSELQQMMDSMQAMRPGQQRQQQAGESPMQEQMNKMGELLQKQQQLMDRTFDLGRQRYRQDEGGAPQEGQEGQPQQGEGGQPMTEEQLQQALKDLQQQQGQLQKDLEAMQKGMEGMGMKPGQGLGEAKDAMGQAEGALGQGEDGQAVDQQGRAMQALRRGARDMMQQMQQAMQQGQGQPGQQPGGQPGQGFGGQQQQSGRDPLGRPRQTQGPDFGQDVGVPDEIDAQRARAILDAIRERLGDALSPQMERDYLERLLRTP
ncbi:TIGR02302 family protein [Aurantimonas sp. Leaf443]|uniref:TIGR02302 family protein n=1 Tax=Aurantimonas sp. Leaf443 TaxID=1736378 RepID=UPI0006F7E86A|nr:TIGR02302 family protein [Aurantimonas sp. Leaf443]KQT85839.1 hypothetical protein ASG48_04295 [Aurantimonas sp. Leaf443]